MKSNKFGSKRMAPLAIALLLAACSREPTNSDGNGTGNADGTGGRGDPPTAPSMDGEQSAGEQSAAPAAGEPPSQQ